MSHDVLVVGAGFAGCTCAERLAEAGLSVLLIDRRNHIGGNAYDHVDAHGVLVHAYGPHIFHTDSPRIFDYLSRFTAWRPYEHRVLARLGGRDFPFPINRRTLNAFFGLDLDAAGAAALLERLREPRAAPRNSEELVLGSVGRELCEAFFRGYTRKQWDMDLSELAVGVAARVPARSDDDDRYFTDRFQCMPRDGYHALFLRMLDRPRIEVRLETDFLRDRGAFDVRHTVFTGPIDAYYDYGHGRLPYRSVRFEHEHRPGAGLVQPVATINYPELAVAHTRITEFRHLTGQVCAGSTLMREYPCWEGDPYYPVPRPENQAMYRRYAALAAEDRSVTFVGRLAQYRYYNMDQAVAAALQAASGIVERLGAA